MLNKVYRFLVFVLRKFYYVTSNEYRLILRGDRISYTPYVSSINFTKMPPCESNCWWKFVTFTKTGGKSLFHQLSGKVFVKSTDFV